MATSLAGCVRLEGLLVRSIVESFVDCLPPTGLLALRCLGTDHLHTYDYGLQRLMLRLPNCSQSEVLW